MNKKQVLIFTGIRLPKPTRDDADKLAKRYGNLSLVLTEAIRLGLDVIEHADIYKDGFVLGKIKELRGK